MNFSVIVWSNILNGNQMMSQSCLVDGRISKSRPECRIMSELTLTFITVRIFAKDVPRLWGSFSMADGMDVGTCQN